MASALEARATGGAAPRTRTGNSETPSPPLTPDQIRSALQLNSPHLVAQLFELAQNRVADETARLGRIEAKAVSLLSAAGLSLTVAATLVVAAFKAEALNFAGWTALLGAIALLSGLASAASAMWALLVSGYGALDEREVFNPTVLCDANDKDHEEDPAAYGTMEYQKHLITDLWLSSQMIMRNHQDKALTVKAGQVFYLLFLLFLCLTFVSILS